MVWRDLKVRYKQTVLGVSWAIIQPFATMVIFSIFFGRVTKMASDGLPYPLFSFAALVPWTFFANSVTQASNSLVASANMIKKIYFPRMTLPIAAILSCLVDFCLAFVVLLGMMVYYGVSISLDIFWIPLFLLIALMAALGVGLWLSALNVQFRDIRYAVPFLIQAWLFATPIAYSSSLLSEPWRMVYGINPMVGVVDGFRWVLLESGSMPGPTVWISLLVTLVVLFSGVIYFSRMEKSFADVI